MGVCNFHMSQLFTIDILLKDRIFNSKLYVSIAIVCFLFRYEPSEPINVTVVEGAPTIVNFTLSDSDMRNEQGKIDIDYPQIISLSRSFRDLSLDSVLKMLKALDNPDF